MGALLQIALLSLFIPAKLEKKESKGRCQLKVNHRNTKPFLDLTWKTLHIEHTQHMVFISQAYREIMEVILYFGSLICNDRSIVL